MEAVALLGALLLLLDRRLPGPARERLVVAYFRLKGGAQARAHSIFLVGGLQCKCPAVVLRFMRAFVRCCSHSCCRGGHLPFLKNLLLGQMPTVSSGPLI